MEVILREHVDNLGKRGEVVKVAPGYARNFLLPRKLALLVTDGNKKLIERELRRILHRQLLTGALDQLTPDQRNVIVLRFLQHLSPRETALALGKSEDRVKKLQERGLDCLRRLLQPARESALV